MASGTSRHTVAARRSERLERLPRLLHERILILDGAMGTMIQAHQLDEAAFRGTRFRDHPQDLRGANDLLVLTQPAVISGIHAAYLDAGADIISTNTFNATRVSMADYALEPFVEELNAAAARLARAAADAAEARDPGRPRYVAGALGPTTRTASLSPMSTIRVPATSPSSSCAPPTRRLPEVSSRAARTCCSSRPSTTRSTPRPPSSRSRRSSRSWASGCR